MIDTTNSTGTTLIELIIALVIAGIVMSLGFTVYGNITRQFHTQSSTAEVIRKKILIKNKIDRICGRLSTVDFCTARELRGVDELSDNIITLRFFDKVLCVGSDTLVENVKEGSFGLIEKSGKKDAQRAVVHWNVTLEKGGWIGGACTVGRW